MTRRHLTATAWALLFIAAIRAIDHQLDRFHDLLEELDDLVANLDRAETTPKAPTPTRRLTVAEHEAATRLATTGASPTPAGGPRSVVVDGDHVALIYDDGGRKIVTNRSELWAAVSNIGELGGVNVAKVTDSMLARHPGVRRVEALPTAALMWGVRRIVTQLVTPPHRGGAMPRPTHAPEPRS